ncbi:MAG: hypothetical protein HYR56_31080 [Acidobacteria bacterium]|nr:hypothetical protein [Acidobacteriota bacterium]MBI3424811.1 hypothetical protein [Acidobacteriota bacterium]
MDVFAILNITAFLLALWQTYKAIEQTREARKQLEKLDSLQNSLLNKLEGQQQLLSTSNDRVSEQGIKQQELLSAASVQSLKLQSQLEQLEEVRLALTTRYIGQYLEYFPQIVSIIERAEKEVVLFLNVPAQGCFSDPTNHLRYRQALERKILDENVNVELTFSNEGLRRASNCERFWKEEPEWGKWKNDNVDKVTKFLSTYKKGQSVSELTVSEFIEILAGVDSSLLKREFVNADCREIDAGLTIGFCLADGKIAVFVLNPFMDNSTSYGFMTSDTKLISALNELSHRQRGMPDVTPIKFTNTDLFEKEFGLDIRDSIRMHSIDGKNDELLSEDIEKT